ncbi:MAG: glucose-6-phosphate dehydrogenase, partial [Armatimonadota bacterium]|nr:glucose-6-phosphate dehydrogenase [Armatimonadota bacterium]
MKATTTLPDRLREGLRLRRMPPPCAVVIFGATGDLARRRLIPALYNLARKGQLPAGYAVVGVGRRPVGTEPFREQLRRAVEESTEVPFEPAPWE